MLRQPRIRLATGACRLRRLSFARLRMRLFAPVFASNSTQWGVECITLEEERMIEEAPAAYKAIDPVVSVQADVGIARPVARMRPLLTCKA